MWTTLRQWCLRTPRTANDPLRRPHAQASVDPTSTSPGDPAAFDADIARRFTATLLGAAELVDVAPTEIERGVLKRLEDAVRAASEEPLVPRMPTILPKLMRLVRRDDWAGHELSELLGREPALLGEVMRLANSAHYAGTQSLANLDAAIARLGRQGIEQVVSRAALAPVFDLAQGRTSAAAGALLWKQAEACAQECATRRLGTLDHFDAYLAGMVANTGLIVALRLLDQCPAGTAPASRAFHDRLATLSARLSARIAHQWRLSEAVVSAIAALAKPAHAGEVSALASALQAADLLSKARVMAD